MAGDDEPDARIELDGDVGDVVDEPGSRPRRH